MRERLFTNKLQNYDIKRIHHLIYRLPDNICFGQLNISIENYRLFKLYDYRVYRGQFMNIKVGRMNLISSCLILLTSWKTTSQLRRNKKIICNLLYYISLGKLQTESFSSIHVDYSLLINYQCNDIQSSCLMATQNKKHRCPQMILTPYLCMCT